MRKFQLVLFFGLSLGLTSPSRADMHALWQCRGISVSVKGPKQASAGAQIVYDIRLRNEGDCHLENGLMTDFIPRTSLYESADPKPKTCPPHTDGSQPEPVPAPVAKIEWDVPGLQQHGEYGFQVVVRAQGAVGRTLLNSACFESPISGRKCAFLETQITSNGN